MRQEPDKKIWEKFVKEVYPLLKIIAFTATIVLLIGLGIYALYTLGIFHEIPKSH